MRGGGSLDANYVWMTCSCGAQIAPAGERASSSTGTNVTRPWQQHRDDLLRVPALVQMQKLLEDETSAARAGDRSLLL